MGEEDCGKTNSSAESLETVKERKASGLPPVFAQYRSNIAALREFFRYLNPVVADLEVGISKEWEAKLDQKARDFVESAQPEEVEALKELGERLSTVAGGEVPSGRLRVESPRVALLVLDIMRETIHAIPSGTHRELLNCSILVSLVAYFELLVADLAHAFYRRAPEAAANDDKVLSVNELRAFGSIDEALDYVVSRRVDDLLRGTLADWQKFFQSRLKIDLEKIVPEWARFNEIIQRRHLIVHAGGKVNRRYLANVDWERLEEPDGPPALGTQLSADDLYLNHALDILEVAGLLLCQSAWQKLAPDEVSMRLGAFAGLVDAVYDCVVSGRWYVAEHLAAWGLEDEVAEEDTLLIFKFNRWLAIKRQGRWEEIGAELESFDCSAKHPRFVLARASLMERADQFFEILPTALGAGLKVEALKEWPILDEMREDPRFQEAISKAETNSGAVTEVA